MNAPPAESRTFMHTMLWWLAVLAAGYGLLQLVTLIVFAVSNSFPYDRYWMRDDAAALGMSLSRILAAMLLLVGGIGLLWWKSWGRIALIIWSMLSMLLGLVTMIGSATFFARQYAATTQPNIRPPVGMFIWNSFYHWLDNCGLPIVLLAALLQPEVSRLWARPKSGGFDVIPVASTVEPPNTGEAPAEVRR